MAQQLLTGGNGTSGQTGLQFRTAINENFTEIYGDSADYVIEKISTITYARPRRSGLTAYSNSNSHTVIQAAITALTPAGAVGTGGGHIHIKSGTYTLTDELVITGWEASGGPYSQLIITGSGWSTWLFQATAAKNCIVIKNKPSVVLKDFKATSTERSALLLDSTGTSEMSIWKGYLGNLILESSSTTHPAVYMKNFMNLTTGFLQIGAPNYHGLIMENDSATTAYGNSFFGHIKLFVSASHAGMLVQSTDGTMTIGHCHFGYFEVGQGLYGIRTSYGKDFSFGVADIEQTTTCISLGTLGAGASNNTYNFTFLGGYLLPLTGGTAIHCAQRGFGNRFVNTWIDGDATSVPILDEQEFKNPNMYDVNLGFNITEANISITEASKTFLRTRSNSDYTTKTNLPTNTTINGLKIPTGGLYQQGVSAQTGAKELFNITRVESNSTGAARPVLALMEYALNPASAPGTPVDYHGLDVTSYGSNNFNANTGIYSVEGRMALSGNATLGKGVGVYGLATNTSASGTANELDGIQAMVQNTNTGTVTAANGILIRTPTNPSGTITTNIGLNINNQNVGTNQWAIKTGLGKVEFGDTMITTQLRLSALNAAPANASDTGTLGEIRITATHLYVCTATNTWVRTALATWP